MAEEFQKRPFARLLILWISGICIATYVPFPGWIGIGTALFFFLFLVLTKPVEARLSFASRGNWGMLFAVFFLCLSIGYVRYRLRWEGTDELSAWQIYFREWQLRLLASLDVLDLAEQEKNVLATLTLGYRQHLDWTIRERFNFSGAAHILSVSGFHVGVVYAFLRACLFFPFFTHQHEIGLELQLVMFCQCLLQDSAIQTRRDVMRSGEMFHQLPPGSDGQTGNCTSVESESLAAFRSAAAEDRTSAAGRHSCSESTFTGSFQS